MNDPARVRRRSDGNATRQRVIDAVVTTVIDVGYYKASSNEIARRAGVAWSSISHLFGTREQLMLDVFFDIGERNEERMVTAQIEGETLEDRLHALLDVLAVDAPLHRVQTQIVLDLAANPKVSLDIGSEMRERNAMKYQLAGRAALEQVLGDVAIDDDAVMYVFGALSGYLQWEEASRVVTDLGDHQAQRALLVEGVAAALRADLARLGPPIP